MEGETMLLSFQDLFDTEAGRKEIEAEITTEHSASSYGQPVIVLEGGNALDLMSWVNMRYRVEEATAEEWQALRKLGFVDGKVYKSLEDALNAFTIDSGFNPFLHGKVESADGRQWTEPTIEALEALGYVVR